MAHFIGFKTFIYIVIALTSNKSASAHYQETFNGYHRHFNGYYWPDLREVNLSGVQLNKHNAESWEVGFKDSSRFWVQYTILPGVVGVGVIGNSFTINILTRKPMRSSTNVYLTALAISDIVYLLFSFSMSWRHFPLINKIWMYWCYSPFGLWITDASSSTSVWLTVSFTVERYIAVCYPMKRKIYCTEKRALCVSILVCIICFALTSTTPLEWKAKVDISQSGEFNETSYSLESTEFGNSEAYRLFYHWFTTVSFVFLPLVILGILNFFLIMAVRASRRERMMMMSENLASILKLQASRVDNRITVTLIAVVILFLICQMPTGLVLIYTSIHVPEGDSNEESVLLGLGNIFNLLVAINAASNFLLYTALCDKYRKQFCRFLCLQRKAAVGGN